MKWLTYRVDLVQAVTSTQNGKCFWVLLVRWNALLSTSGQTGSTSSYFWSMGYRSIKDSATRTSILNIRGVHFCFFVLFLSLIVVLNSSSSSQLPMLVNASSSSWASWLSKLEPYNPQPIPCAELIDIYCSSAFVSKPCLVWLVNRFTSMQFRAQTASLLLRLDHTQKTLVYHFHDQPENIISKQEQNELVWTGRE